MKIVIAALIILPVLMLALSVFLAVRKQSKGASGKQAFKTHLAVVGALVVMMTLLTVGASAAGTNEAPPADNGTAMTASADDAANSEAIQKGMGYIAAALSIGLAGIGAGLSIAAGAPAAIGATSENPKMFGKGMIFCVLGEAIAIYGLVISFMILLV